MPYVASTGTHVRCRTGVPPARTVGDPKPRWRLSAGDRYGAQISLVHNCFRSAGVSAVTVAGGATYGAG